MNELVVEKSLWRRYWKWLILPAILIITPVVLITIRLGDPIADFTKVIVDPPLYENALEIVKNDTIVTKWTGDLEPVDVFRVLEGDVIYSEDNRSVQLTVGVIGSKKRAKMDIKAEKNGDQWEYTQIRIRTKKPKRFIMVLGTN